LVSEGVQWPGTESVTAVAPNHGATCLVYKSLQ